VYPSRHYSDAGASTALSFPTGGLELTEARHPLPRRKLTRVRWLGGASLIFTRRAERYDGYLRANAGGKTVVLKTAGLLALMALSGMPVPAREARFPFYASVLADIGGPSIACREPVYLHFARRKHLAHD